MRACKRSIKGALATTALTAVLALVGVVAVVPGGVAWADEPAVAPDPLENGSYEVSDADSFARAMQEVAKLSEGSEATIEVTANVDLTGSEVSWGAEGVKLTVKGGAGSTPLITVDGDRLDLAGQVSFENIHVSASVIYANGHALVLGDGFGGGADGQTRMTVYGGSDSNLDLAGGSASVTVLDGVYKLIVGGNSAGTLTGDTYVEFGGDARFPTAADGKGEDDTATGSSAGYNLYQAAEYESSFNPVMVSYTKRGVIPYAIYGGGINADTKGNATVEMTGGEVYQIFGGGAALMNPNYAGSSDKSGLVDGDTTVHVTGGEVKSIYGGGYNGIDVFGGDDYDEVPDNARSTRAVVSGTAHVTIEGNAVAPACEQSEDASTSGADPAAVHGGSFHSTVGATEVVVGGNARIETGGAANTTGYGYGSLFGAGTNDIVLGTTSVTLKDTARIGSDKNVLNTSSALTQGSCGSMTPLGYAAKSGCYLGGAKFSYGSEILNEGSAPYAATATVEGGRVDVLTIGNKSRNLSQASKTVTGNVLLQQTGGTVAAIEASCISEKNVEVTGNVDVKVSGGTVQSYIMGRYDSSHTTDKVIVGKATLELSGTAADGYLTVPLIENMDSVTVKNGAKIAIEGSWTVNDYEGKYGYTNPNPDYMNPVTGVPFYQVKELTVEKGAALAISQEHALIEGNITINGQLEIKRSNNGVEAPLTAEGTAGGTGSLLPFEGTSYGTGSLPKEGEEYVFALKEGSTMELTLANAGESGLGVGVQDEGSTQSAWYIVKEEPAEQLWYYEVYCEVINEDGTPTWTCYKDGQGGWALPDATVSIDQDDFNGEDLGWLAVDGSGNEILGTHYVYDENYPTGETSHRLSATCAEATKDNPLKIYYRATPHTVTYKFGGDAPSHVKLPADQDTCYSAPITVAEEPTAPGWTFKGWTSDDVTIEDGAFLMPNEDVTITGTWERTATSLTPTATSLVAYEGGEGSSANSGDALPEPVWRFEAEGWTLYFDGKEQPEGTAAFNWAYFPEEGDAEQTDAATKGVYELRAWPLDNVSEVVAKDKNGTYYYLDLTSEQVVKDADGNDVTVRVRDVTDDDAAETLAPEVFKPVYGEETSHVAMRSAIQDGACDASEAHAHVADGTTFEINGIDGLTVSNDAKISLLFDEFIPDVLGQSDRMNVLDGKARTAAGGVFATSENVEAEFRYMDLVDTTNGNVWVAPADESAVTVFLPYTRSMTAESEIAVVYFDDLTRDYTVDLDAADLDEEVANTTAHALAVTKTADGITFEVPYQEFGPFEIMWVNDDGDEGPEGPTGGDQKPAGDKNDQGDKNDDIPDTGDESFSAVPVLVAGCVVVVVAAGVLVWVRKRQ
ncbi:InlB B-repeat-containing protein [Thermophilibacter sp.]|uniref:InlB B-repeat-containing protein n=1 Tax=Thermophilibacter sp. TaxID=2847309 RepID=UPI003A92B436